MNRVPIENRADEPMTEEADTLCLSAASAAELLAGAPWQRFAVVGDSLAAGIGDPTPGYWTLPWPVRLADSLRRAQPGILYRNVAVVGATASDTLTRQLPEASEFAPDLLAIVCGANDIWQRNYSPTQLEATLRSLFETAATTGAFLFTFTYGRRFDIPSIPGFGGRVVGLNESLRRCAEEFGAVVVDFWDHPVNARANLLSADEVHWSAMGQAAMAATTTRALASNLVSLVAEAEW